MLIWRQRRASLDLLQAVRKDPSLQILVETYREVQPDAFDMGALRDVLGGTASASPSDRMRGKSLPGAATKGGARLCPPLAVFVDRMTKT